MLIVLIAAIPAFIEGFDVNLYAFGSPLIIRDIHSTAALLGTVAASYAAGIAVFSIVGGYLFDKFSVKYSVMISVAIFTVFTLLTGFVTSSRELLVVRFMVGVGIGVFQPAIMALLGDIFFETRGRAVSAFAVFFGGGLMAGPYLISPFLPHYQAPFIISAVMGLVSLLLFYAIIPKTYKTLEKKPLRFAGIFQPNVIILSLTILLFGITLFGFSSYYSDYLLKVLSLPSGQAARIVSMEGLGGLLLAFPIGYLADKRGRKQGAVLAALFVMIGALGVFSVSHQVVLLLILTFIFGAGRGIYISLIAAMGQDSVDDSVAGQVTGWLFLVFNIGAFLGGPLFSALLPYGFVTAGLITLGLTSILSFASILFTRPTTLNLSTLEE